MTSSNKADIECREKRKLHRTVSAAWEIGDERLTPHLLQNGHDGKQSLRLQIEYRGHIGDELTKDGIL